MNPHTIRQIINLITHTIAKIETINAESLPKTGACVIVANHLGRLDAMMAYSYAPRDDLAIMVAEKYKKQAIYRFVVKELNGIWVDRFNADLVAMRTTLNRLKAGEMVVIAPEGTRSPTATLQEGKPGATYLAMKANAPLIPVGIRGTEDEAVKAAWKRLRRPRIYATVGKPFTLPPMKGKNRDEALKEATDEIMCQIAALLPPEYRGVYADHPRLKELLAEQK